MKPPRALVPAALLGPHHPESSFHHLGSCLLEIQHLKGNIFVPDQHKAGSRNELQPLPAPLLHLLTELCQEQ